MKEPDFVRATALMVVLPNFENRTFLHPVMLAPRVLKVLLVVRAHHQGDRSRRPGLSNPSPTLCFAKNGAPALAVDRVTVKRCSAMMLALKSIISHPQWILRGWCAGAEEAMPCGQAQRIEKRATSLMRSPRQLLPLVAWQPVGRAPPDIPTRRRAEPDLLTVYCGK